MIILIVQFVWANTATATMSKKAMRNARREAAIAQSHGDDDFYATVVYAPELSPPELTISLLQNRKERKRLAKTRDKVASSFKSIDEYAMKMGLADLEIVDSPIGVADAVFDVEPVVDVEKNAHKLKLATDRLFDFFEPKYVSVDAWVDSRWAKAKSRLMLDLKKRFPALHRVKREEISKIVSLYLKDDVEIAKAALRIVDQATAEIYMQFIDVDIKHTRMYRAGFIEKEILDKIVLPISPQLGKIMTAISILLVVDLHMQNEEGTADFVIGVICKSVGCSNKMNVEQLLLLSKKNLAEAALLTFDYQNAIYPDYNDFWK